MEQVDIGAAGGCELEAVRPLRRSRHARDRTWKNRAKVSACTSALFPWEAVLGHLGSHPRSLILLQMVNRHLRQLLATDHPFWQRIYARNFFVKSYLAKRVRDPQFPQLQLWKLSTNDVAYYTGGLHVDKGVPATDLPPKEALTAYIRKWFALKHGTRCGLCGCRFRHDVYWSLGKRVCRLCVADNVVSAHELHATYGLDFSLIAKDVARRVFYFTATPAPKEDRVPATRLGAGDAHARAAQYLFWRPHLEKLFDLPERRREQERRRLASCQLAARFRRRWVVQLRAWMERYARKSIDCFLIRLFRNERSRVLFPYKGAATPGGPDWAFPETRPKTRYTAATGEPVVALYRRVWEYEDWCVPE